MTICSIYEYFIANNIQLILVITLSICIVVLFFCRWWDFILLLKKQKEDAAVNPLPSAQPKLTVVVPVDNISDTLENNLCHLLNQEYPDYEVIVVQESESKDVDTMIERLQTKYKFIRKTFVPQSNRSICKRKLSITLGTRAARGEWIVLTHPECIPASTGWLNSYAKHLVDSNDVVLGYANYDANVPKYYHYKRFRRFLMGFSANHLNKPYLGDACNIAFRRSAFLDRNGFADSLGIIGGEAEMLVKSLSDGGNVVYNLDPKGFVIESCPYLSVLHQCEITQSSTLRHCAKGAKLSLFRDSLASIVLYLTYLLILFGWTFFALKWPYIGDYKIEGLCIDLGLLLLSLLHLTLPLLVVKSTTRHFLTQPIKFAILYWDFILPWDNICLSVKSWRLRKDFRCK